MKNETNELIDTLYDKESPPQIKNNANYSLKINPRAKYQIFDQDEFTRGREVLGELIVHGMITSGGTDVDWLIEHNGGFIILEFKGFHNDKINIPKGQMIAYKNLHEKLNQVTKCHLYIIGCDENEFSNPDSKVWIFEMNQWIKGGIPKNENDIYDEKIQSNKYIVYREYMEEITVEVLRKIIDTHWKEFDQLLSK